MSDRWEAVWEIEGGFGGTRNNQCLSQDDRSADGDQNERRQGVAAPLSGATSDPAKISGLEGVPQEKRYRHWPKHVSY